MAAGSIVIDLLMRTGSFETDTDRASKVFDKRMRAMKSSASSAAAGITGALAAIGVGVSGAAFAALVKGSIDAADHLNDLSKKTGVAVESLGGIGFAAKQAGGDVDSASEALGKLNKTLAAAAAGDKGAAEPFIKMGIAIKDAAGNTRQADAVFADIADRFKGYADGPEKAALALALFGKAGADQIPLLNEGGEALRKNIEYYKRYSGVTAEVAGQSDQFNDTLEKIKLLSGAFGNQLAAQLLPALQGLAGMFLHAKEQGDGFKGVAVDIAELLKGVAVSALFVTQTFTGTAQQLGAFAAQIAALGSGDFKGFKAIREAADEDLEAARKRFQDFRDAINGRGGNSAAAADDGKDPTDRRRKAFRLTCGNAGPDNSAALLKKELDVQLQAIKDFAAGRKQVFDFQARYLASEYQDGLTSLRQFFADDRNIRQGALEAQLQAIDAEIAAQERYKARAGKPEDRIDAEKRIAAAVAERGRTVVKYQQDAALAALEEARALENLQDRYADLQGTILSLQGKTAQANAARIDQQVRDAQRLVTQAGGDPGTVDVYAKLLRGQNELSDAQRAYNGLLEHQRNAEESMLLAAQASGATELYTLRAVGTSRQDALVQLAAMTERAQALAVALGTPEAVQFADQLAVALKRAVAEVDPLLGKIRDVGKEAGEAIANGLGEALINGGSLRDMLKGIEQDLLRISTRELVTKPLGQMLGNFIGGNGQQSGGGGLLGSLFSAFGGSGGGAGGGAGNYNFGGGFAAGGEPPVGRPSMVGEMGRELFVPYTEGRILSADQTRQVMGGGGRPVTVNNNFTINGQTDRRTQLQISAEAGSAVRRAMARNT